MLSSCPDDEVSALWLDDRDDQGATHDEPGDLRIEVARPVSVRSFTTRSRA
ncbi:hypothetical protein [Thiocapsa bogorovii]|uniref:hypothetical protein n=1 Tax=Thiocapsa bogorovii TaxID=521689 RepID=UPI001E636B5D|nr:hypothetical protein [Thiocapsa bogorovii]UHD16019.1 hypothetical protein LT988_22670 [Thiocapsa bogorovii]